MEQPSAQQQTLDPIGGNHIGLLLWKIVAPLASTLVRSYAADERKGSGIVGDTDAIESLRDDFRHQLEIFYASLKLAPPYDSVEKAITTLVTKLKAMPLDERTRIAADTALRWEEYHKAFVASDLHLKHRGIILGLVRSGQTAELPPEHEEFLRAYRSERPPAHE
jgi:hypothetical protein